jgi:tetratricopeptide (TPR) repeat protein
MKLSFRAMIFFIAALCIISFVQVYAQQNLTFPDLSQAASVSQRIGLTDITITYHRPLVKGRVIWGGLVAYNQIWRAGADENTTIEFSTPVKINGNELPAGKYGFHTIPTENEWTLIFSKDNAAWGSYFYNQSHDALRIQVKPEPAPFLETLTYFFDNPEPASVTAALYWEKLKIPFKIDVDLNKTIVDNMATELTGRAGFNPAAFQQAANYCLKNNYDLEQALIWVDKSISQDKGFGNLYTKSQILAKTGKKDEAKKLEAEAMKIATENDLNSLGNQLASNKEYDKAIDIYSVNLKSHPKSVQAYMGLAGVYSKTDKKDLALKNYDAAKNLSQDQNTRDRIQKAIDNLKMN